jgi:hypothetical protein
VWLEQLRDVGLDFTFLLDGLLLPKRIVIAGVEDSEYAGPGKGKIGSALAHARQSVYIHSKSSSKR